MSAPGLDKHIAALNISNQGTDLVYTKNEKILTDFIYRKTRSVTINADILAGAYSGGNKPDVIRVVFKDVVIEAARKDIEKLAKCHEYYDEVKWQYPVKSWKVVAGADTWKKILKSL